MNIYNLTYPALEAYFTERSENKAKAKIIFNKLYKEKVIDFNDIECLSSRVLDKLKTDFSDITNKLTVLDKSESNDAAKLLLKLADGNTIESVLMKHDYGNSLCISTQVGCGMGCAFCESGRLKKVRNLEAYEMVLQITTAEQALKANISRIALMGIGEPLDNFANVMDFIDIAGHRHGMDIAARHITISTCGLVPEIEKLMIRIKDSESHCNLAVSLHAPNDIIRSKLMPVNKVYGVDMLLEAVRKYSEIKNKKTTLEYILLKDINDSDSDAYKLAELITSKSIKCYINLIPYNETENSCFKRPEHERIMRFYDILRKSNIRATIRREFGGDLKAACGQLRSEQAKNHHV